MSRSYKKHPVRKICGFGKEGKKRANKMVRKAKDAPPGKSCLYKRMFETWLIHEFVSYYSKEKLFHTIWADPDSSDSEDEEYIQFWECHFRRK